MIRTLLIVAALGLGLGACTDLDASLFGDTDDGASNANGCTSADCPQAARYCVARGYAPGTPAYARCLTSVEENLRKESR